MLIAVAACSGGPRRALQQCIDNNAFGTQLASDSLAREAYRYYSHHGSKKERMQSAYFMGLAEYECGNFIESSVYFTRAYEMAVRLNDCRYKGLSGQRLSEIYEENFDWATSNHFAREAISAFEVCGDTLLANYSRLMLARHYIEEDKEKVERITDSLLQSSPLDSGIVYHASLLRAFSLAQRGEYIKAEESFNRLAQTGWPVGVDVLSWEAYIQEKKGLHQKADSLMEQVGQKMETFLDSTVYFNTMRNILALRGNYEGAYEKLSKASEMQDREVEVRLSRSVTHAMHSYFQEQYNKERTRRYTLFLTYILSVIILIALIAGTAFALRYHRQSLLLEIAKTEELTQELSMMQSNDKGKNSVIFALVQDKIKVMADLAAAYSSWTEEAIKEREEKQGKMLKEDILTHFHKEIQKLRSDNSFIPKLEDALNHAYDDVMVRVREDSKGVMSGPIRIKENDYKLLVLFFAGFSNKSAQFILDMTEDAVRTRKKNLRQIFRLMDNESAEQYLSMLDGGATQFRHGKF